MEKDGFLGHHLNGLSLPHSNGAPMPMAMAMAMDPLQHCFLDLGPVHLSTSAMTAATAEPSALFDSALSSLVSSPSSDPAPAAGDGVAIRELIGRLGSICGDDGSPSSRYGSCHSTPLSSPPKPALPTMPLPVSCFGGGGGRSYVAGLPGQFGAPEAGRLSRASSSQSLMAAELAPGVGHLAGSDAELAGGSGDAPSRASSESNGKKRKASAKAKGKAPEEDLIAKRCKVSDVNGSKNDKEMKPKAEQNGGTDTNGDAGQKKGEEGNAKPPEPPKDYIHVRARRGQATDSHSLAERVRREKISERMKLLQDLVPGCNKVTGKAVMLDEIINYVQSLQRQVEFLSMKLATVNPRPEFDMDNFISKDAHQSSTSMAPPPLPSYSLEAASSGFSYVPQPQGTPLQSAVTNGVDTQYSLNLMNPAMRRNIGVPHPAPDGFEGASSEAGNFWEDDLHSVVQMGFVQSQEAAFSSQSFHGPMQPSHMNVGL